MNKNDIKNGTASNKNVIENEYADNTSNNR